MQENNADTMWSSLCGWADGFCTYFQKTDILEYHYPYKLKS